jgi:hypothetical protein
MFRYFVCPVFSRGSLVRASRLASEKLPVLIQTGSWRKRANSFYIFGIQTRTYKSPCWPISKQTTPSVADVDILLKWTSVPFNRLSVLLPISSRFTWAMSMALSLSRGDYIPHCIFSESATL